MSKYGVLPVWVRYLCYAFCFEKIHIWNKVCQIGQMLPFKDKNCLNWFCDDSGCRRAEKFLPDLKYLSLNTGPAVLILLSARVCRASIMKHLVTTHPAACSCSLWSLLKYFVQILKCRVGFLMIFLTKRVVDSLLIKLRGANLKWLQKQ